MKKFPTFTLLGLQTVILQSFYQFFGGLRYNSRTENREFSNGRDDSESPFYTI